MSVDNRPSWVKKFEIFDNLMLKKILDNMEEKGLNWQTATESDLLELMAKYVEREDWTSVANMAFMLFDKQNLVKI